MSRQEHPKPLRSPAGLLAQAARLSSSLLVAVAIVVLLALAVGPRLGGYRTLVVLSNSMQPEFSAGDVIVVTRERSASIRRGQVIVYHAPVGDGHIVTHRVSAVVKGGDRPTIRTKGDANGQADPWTAKLGSGDVWTYRFSVPWAGYLIQGLRQPALHKTTMWAIPSLLVIFMLIQIWAPDKQTARGGRRTRADHEVERAA